jgi:hypothetical protein
VVLRAAAERRRQRRRQRCLAPRLRGQGRPAAGGARRVSRRAGPAGRSPHPWQLLQRGGRPGSPPSRAAHLQVLDVPVPEAALVLLRGSRAEGVAARAICACAARLQVSARRMVAGSARRRRDDPPPSTENSSRQSSQPSSAGGTHRLLVDCGHQYRAPRAPPRADRAVGRSKRRRSRAPAGRARTQPGSGEAAAVGMRAACRRGRRAGAAGPRRASRLPAKGPKLRERPRQRRGAARRHAPGGSCHAAAHLRCRTMSRAGPWPWGC